MVAAGEIDIYWDAGCYAWDVAAGAVIVTEAGGLFSGGRDGFRNEIAPGAAVMSRRYVFIRAVQGSEVSGWWDLLTIDGSAERDSKEIGQ